MANSSTAKQSSLDSTKFERKNQKLIRDTFSMPDSDYQLIAEIMERTPAMATRTTKSEIVRAGIKVLYNMDDSHLQEVLTQVERLKTGRPTKRKTKIRSA